MKPGEAKRPDYILIVPIGYETHLTLEPVQGDLLGRRSLSERSQRRGSALHLIQGIPETRRRLLGASRVACRVGVTQRILRARDLIRA